MYPCCSPFLLFMILFVFPQSSDSQGDEYYRACTAPKRFDCGSFADNISFPFQVEDGRPDYCGHPGYKITCENDSPEIQIGSKTYRVIGRIDYANRLLTVVEKQFADHGYCPVLSEDDSLPQAPLFDIPSFELNITLFYCSEAITNDALKGIPCLQNEGNPAYYYTTPPPSSLLTDVHKKCEVRVLPISSSAHSRWATNTFDIREAVEEGFQVYWLAGEVLCQRCRAAGGLCGSQPSDPAARPVCFCPDESQYADCLRAPRSGNKSRKGLKTAIGIGCGVGGFLIACVLFFLLYRYCRQRRLAASTTLLSRDVSPDPSSKHDLEKCHSTLCTHIFSYKELQEATNNFDSSRELGDGGFGTVYFGKLRDGRSVAVKRLYENNYKRVEQFMNEVQILSSLRHQNLVTLYGCTSRHSRELLLVYEFIPNGTVADHLHGEHAHKGALTWPVRMNVAMETAEALAYLHAIEPPIIHRDVKTNNILLDSNFRVKVADFGLSRLFPMDVTHVSTTPQGTPGYVDPDYHKCYQLTDKSDVYSFGVVLMEIISSKPAVDITRHRHEINLAYMAINKIHSGSLHELVDPDLGFNTDDRVRKMITLVAELGFRCLQEEKDMRPSMEEVVEVLKGIKMEDGMGKKTSELDIQMDDIGLLKSVPPLSPDSVMDNWSTSKSTTPNASA